MLKADRGICMSAALKPVGHNLFKKDRGGESTGGSQAIYQHSLLLFHCNNNNNNNIYIDFQILTSHYNLK